MTCSAASINRRFFGCRLSARSMPFPAANMTPSCLTVMRSRSAEIMPMSSVLDLAERRHCHGDEDQFRLNHRDRRKHHGGLPTKSFFRQDEYERYARIQ